MAQDDRTTLISRIGTFFFLIGLLLAVLFITSDMANNADFIYLLTALVFFIIGGLFKQKGSIPPQPGMRFEGLRKLQKKRRETREINDKNKK